MKQILPIVTILILLTFIGTNNGFCEYSTPPIKYVPKDGKLVIEYYNEPLYRDELIRILSDSQNEEISWYVKRAERRSITSGITGGVGVSLILFPIVFYPLMKADPETNPSAEMALFWAGIGVVLSGIGLAFKVSADKSLLLAIELYNNEYNR
jgi:hypothetical protein